MRSAGQVRASLVAASLLATLCVWRTGAQYDRKFSISGTVINSASGDPVQRVLVQLGVAAVFTDSDGRFAFRDLRAGPVTVVVRRPGFFGDSPSRERALGLS